MEDQAHVLVVANRTAESEELKAALAERAREGPVRFSLLVPATPHGVAWAADMHSGAGEAGAHMEAAVGRLRAAGLDVTGEVGDPDPAAAVQDMINAGGGFDEVIVSTLPTHVSRWLKMDLPHRVERITGLPVRHVVGHEVAATSEGR